MIAFVSPLFQFPIPWIDAYIAMFNRLGPRWQHWLFTDVMPAARHGNVVVHRMTAGEFVALAEAKTGCRPYVLPIPSPKFGDTRPAFGHIFEDYLRDADWWGHTDMDMVLGRLDDYLPDAVLDNVDIFSDDPNAINGIFSLYRNAPRITHLYRQHPQWQAIFQDPRYHAFDETEFSDTVRAAAAAGTIRFMDRFWHEHDRQADHAPIPNITFRDDGALINRTTQGPMMSFHFKLTKPVWPVDR